MYSALKKDGRCLYELARRGETVEREPRRVVIHELTVSDFDGESFTMATLVSKHLHPRARETSAERSARRPLDGSPAHASRSFDP